MGTEPKRLTVLTKRACGIVVIGLTVLTSPLLNRTRRGHYADAFVHQQITPLVSRNARSTREGRGADPGTRRTVMSAIFAVVEQECGLGRLTGPMVHHQSCSRSLSSNLLLLGGVAVEVTTSSHTCNSQRCDPPGRAA